jgi:cytochrome P450
MPAHATRTAEPISGGGYVEAQVETGPDDTADLEDVYRLFVERRRSEPVKPASITMGLNTADGVILYTYDDCARVLRDPQTFSSRGYAETVDLVFGRTIIGMDDPEHKRNRDLVAHAFQQRTLASWTGEVISAVVNDLIDRFQPSGRADLVTDLGLPLPIRVTSRILGLPEAGDLQFHQWAVDLIEIAEDITRGLEASAALRDYFAGVVSERRRKPTNDVISQLVTAEVEGVQLEDEAIYSFLRLLLPAGIETTARSIPFLVRRLLTHPEQLDALRRDRSLVPQAIEEGLRHDSPAHTVIRIATRDTEFGGVAVPAGSLVTVCVGSANRDERRWVDPERFDIHRPQLQHLAFAAGPHMCLGLHLARMESAIALNAVLDRLPGLRFDPERGGEPSARVPPSGMPALSTLPVLFDTP